MTRGANSEGRAVVAMVDDDPVDAFAVKKSLTQADGTLEFRYYSSSEDFLRAIEDGSASLEHPLDLPDLILLDVNMPRMDGYELLARIRKIKDVANLPVIMFTTSEEHEHITRSYAAGANSHIVKPSTVAEMRKFAESIVNYWLTLVSLPGD